MRVQHTVGRGVGGGLVLGFSFFWGDLEFRLEGRLKLADPKTPDSKGIHE